jgi:hypothetical protein
LVIVTIYVVVAVGVAIGFAMVVLDKEPLFGNHE